MKTFKIFVERGLNSLHQEIKLYKNEADIWKPLPGTTNTGGVLCMHLLGNINHFLGIGLLQNNYVRDRDLEFENHNLSQEQMLKEIDQCLVMANVALSKESELTPDQMYPVPFPHQGMVSTEFMFMQLAVHLNYHLGQINYHRRFFNKAE